MKTKPIDEVKISVIMPVYNAEKYLSEAIDSILNQSFKDFELIIINDGSTDKSLSIIKSYSDNRIVLLENKHNFIEALNSGIKNAKGKYIVRMDADDIMYIDRLKIQYSIMEEEKSITVCSSNVTPFGKNVPVGLKSNQFSGLMENPVLTFLKGNPIAHPTVIIRKDFIDLHSLRYENYPYAEDYKLWFDIARLGGVFFVESQSLLGYRVSEQQVSIVKCKEQKETSEQIKKEILNHLIDNSGSNKYTFQTLLKNLESINEINLLSINEILNLYYSIFSKNVN